MSQLITWNSSLSVGIAEIDDQHRSLVDLLNQLYTALVSQNTSSEMERILNELGNYTRIHFALEESMMRLLGYPDYEEHKRMHEKLLMQLDQLTERFRNDDTISFELLMFLKDWLTKHIQESDQAYTKHFFSCGVKSKSVSSGNWMKRILSR